jgi:hypothetical protein
MMKPLNERAMRFLIRKYKGLGMASSEICDRMRVMVMRRGWGGCGMASRLSWYGLRD